MVIWRETNRWAPQRQPNRHRIQSRRHALADWGRKEISIAEHEMPGLMSIRRKYAAGQAADRRARHRFAAHDHSDRGADRDAGRSGRDGALGELQHFLHAGSRRRRHRRRRRSGVRLEGRVARRILVVHLSGAQPSRTARVPQLVVDDGGDVTLLIHKGYELENGSDWVNTPFGQPRREGHQGSAEEGPRRRSAALARNGEGMARRFRRDHHRRAPPLQDAGSRASCWFRRST